MKINEKQLVLDRLKVVKDWDDFQKILCFLRLWRAEVLLDKTRRLNE